jgi:hypothetical protein
MPALVIASELALKPPLNLAQFNVPVPAGYTRVKAP